MKMVRVPLYFEVCNSVLSNTTRSKYSNCTINSLKQENREICFYYHCEAHLIHYFDQDQTPLLMHVIQCRI